MAFSNRGNKKLKSNDDSSSTQLITKPSSTENTQNTQNTQNTYYDTFDSENNNNTKNVYEKLKKRKSKQRQKPMQYPSKIPLVTSISTPYPKEEEETTTLSTFPHISDDGYYEHNEMDESLQHSLFDSPNKKNKAKDDDDDFPSDSDEDGKNIINSIEPTITDDEDERDIINPKFQKIHSNSLEIINPQTVALQNSLSQSTPKRKELSKSKLKQSPILRPKTASSVRSQPFFNSPLRI